MGGLVYGQPATALLLSGSVFYGKPLLIAGKGAHFEGGMKEHTKAVPNEIDATAYI